VASAGRDEADRLTADHGVSITTEVAERHVDPDDGARVALDTLVIARRPAG
jgi:hypothetical protein